MARSKDKSSDENLRGHNRQLRSENKALRRQVARLEKQLARQPIDTIEEDTPEEVDSTPDADSCPKCHKELVSIDLGIKTVLSCRSCSYRIASKD